MIVLVACSGQKNPHLSQAKDLYTSPLFRFGRAYAEAFAEEWFILSARYGIVHPDILLNPYERDLNTLGAKARALWRAEVFEDATRRGLHRQGNHVQVLAGKHYAEPFRSLKTATFPLDGLGIGKRLAWLKNALGGGDQ